MLFSVTSPSSAAWPVPASFPSDTTRLGSLQQQGQNQTHFKFRGNVSAVEHKPCQTLPSSGRKCQHMQHAENDVTENRNERRFNTSNK